jgi:release factor glutamine methyltransferase
MTHRWTVLELLREAVRYMAEKGIPTPRLDAEVLLAHALGCRRIDLYLRHDQPLTSGELDTYRHLVRRRCKGEPVAYLTGVKEFWSLPVRVTPDVLIPRSETELLVELALEYLRGRLQSASSGLRVLEIGTGSGAIILALAREMPKGVEWVATDRSPQALNIARQNARDLGLYSRIRFLRGDLFSPLAREDGPFSLILSNPPYVPSSEIHHLPREVRDFEPKDALDGGEDGLEVIRRLLVEAPAWLEEEGMFLLEAGAGQRKAIESFLNTLTHWHHWSWARDLQGLDRALRLWKGGQGRHSSLPTRVEGAHG